MTVSLAVGLALALAATAQARTWTLYAGGYQGPGFKAVIKQVVGKNGALKAYNPSIDTFSATQLLIHVGDQVQWLNPGGHTVTFEHPNGADIPLIGPDPLGTKVAAVKDAAGSPFWFNGQPQLDFGLAAVGAVHVRTVGGKQVGVEDGSAIVGSGLYTGNGNPPPFVLTFTKAGLYKYECTIHPNMDASVRVLPRGAAIPSPAAVVAGEKRALASASADGAALSRYTPPANTVSGGHDKGQVSLLAFFPCDPARGGRHDGHVLPDLRRGDPHVLVRTGRLPEQRLERARDAGPERRRAADAGSEPAGLLPE